MATFNYSGLATTVDRLLTKFGTNILQTRDASDEWNPYPDPTDNILKYRNVSTGAISETLPAGLVQTKTGAGVVTQITEEDQKDFLIDVGDKLLLIYNILPPKTGDTFKVGAVIYRYVNHKLVRPADTTLLYKVQVRI